MAPDKEYLTGPRADRDCRCDLHIHTRFSDGLLTPHQVVYIAKQHALTAIAITDHDTLDGIAPAQAAGQALGVKVIAGVEMSCSSDHQDIHILGYLIDHQSPELGQYLHSVRLRRLERAERMIAKLREQGIRLNAAKVLHAAGSSAVGRPHIAQALLESGYVSSFDEAFARFIGYHSPAYVPKMKITPAQAIEVIQSFGGVAVAAHPGTLRNPAVLDEMIAAGLQGIEVYHPEHNASVTLELLSKAKQHNLLVTGGSDCHGGRSGPVLIGSVTVPLKHLEAMRHAAQATHDSDQA